LTGGHAKARAGVAELSARLRFYGIGQAGRTHG